MVTFAQAKVTIPRNGDSLNSTKSTHFATTAKFFVMLCALQKKLTQYGEKFADLAVRLLVKTGSNSTTKPTRESKTLCEFTY